MLFMLKGGANFGKDLFLAMRALEMPRTVFWSIVLIPLDISFVWRHHLFPSSESEPLFRNGGDMTGFSLLSATAFMLKSNCFLPTIVISASDQPLATRQCSSSISI